MADTTNHPTSFPAPPITTPFVDRDGVITFVWYRWLLSIFQRTGDAAGMSLDSIASFAISAGTESVGVTDPAPLWVATEAEPPEQQILPLSSDAIAQTDPAPLWVAAEAEPPPDLSGFALAAASAAEAAIASTGSASDLIAGTIPTGRISGSYTGITGVGTLTAGTWNATVISVQYGGTGADLSATGGASQVLKQTSAGAAVTVAQLAASDLSNGTTGTTSVVLATTPTITNPILTAQTFATLPGAPTAGQLAYITDSNTAVWGAAAAGAGANKVLVWYNSANWTVVGA